MRGLQLNINALFGFNSVFHRTFGNDFAQALAVNVAHIGEAHAQAVNIPAAQGRGHKA